AVKVWNWFGLIWVAYGSPVPVEFPSTRTVQLFERLPFPSSLNPCTAGSGNDGGGGGVCTGSDQFRLMSNDAMQPATVGNTAVFQVPLTVEPANGNVRICPLALNVFWSGAA